MRSGTELSRFLRVFLLTFADLHAKYVVVQQASNTIVFVCKTDYIICLREELGLNTERKSYKYMHFVV